MDGAVELLAVILGGGTVAVLSTIFKAIREHSEGRTAREDTAINRWRDIATEREREATRKGETIAAYRRWYPRLWAAYMGKPGPHDSFPPDPAQPDDLSARFPSVASAYEVGEDDGGDS